MRFLGIILTVVFLSCCTTDKSPVNSKAGQSWNNSMHRLSANHSAIVPIVADPKEFYNPKNTSLLRNRVNEMVIASEEMTKDKTAPNADPIIAFTAQGFKQEVQGVSEMLDTGKLQAAHYTLSNIGNYCVSCHSRADRGSVNFPLPWATNISQMPSLQKANYYLANRQYETAHMETEKIIQDNGLMLQDPNGWMLLLQKDLSVIVRGQNNLPRAQKLIDLALKNKNLLDYLKHDIQAWSEILKSWNSEDKKAIDRTKNLNFVKKLLDQARTSKYSRGQSGYVHYLRASGILHELLEGPTNKSSYASTLYYAGITAEALKNVDVWKLGEHYFEVCIENSPHSPVSMNCFNELENLTYSSHPNMKLLPDLEKRVLSQLSKYRDLSQILPYTKDVIRSGGQDRGVRF